MEESIPNEEKYNIENGVPPLGEGFDFLKLLEAPRPSFNESHNCKKNVGSELLQLSEKTSATKAVITKKLRTRTIYARVHNSDEKHTSDDDEERYEVTKKRKTRVAKVTVKTEEYEQVFVKRRRFRRNSFFPRTRESFNGNGKLPWTLAGLSLHMSDNKAALEFCQSKKLLPMSKQCPVCQEQMLFSEKLSSDKGLGFVFRCSRRACQIVRSARSGTWFEKSKLPIRKSLLLTYCFATNFPFSLAVHESSFTAGCTSPTTVSDWYSYCREVCVDAMVRQMGEKLGGEDKIIEMDEIVIGERLVKKKIIPGQAILGFYCKETERVSVACIPRNKRDGSALISLIEDHVHPGSIIHVSCWKPEDTLSPGYHHIITNYRIKFTVLENGARNVGIEKIWRLLKSYVPQIDNGKKPDQLFDYLCEFLWRRWVDMNKKDPFEAFLDDAAVLYTLPNDDDDFM